MERERVDRLCLRIAREREEDVKTDITVSALDR